MLDDLHIQMKDIYICEGCEHVLDEEPESPAYECGNCGEQYSREMTEGGDHRCPSCNKFGAKVSDWGCPECGSPMNHEYGFKCPHCDHAIIGSEL